MKIKKLSEFDDVIGFIILSAPDRFPSDGNFSADQGSNLVIAFDMLYESFPLVEKKVKSSDHARQLRQMLADALYAYQRGDKKKGAHLLQDFEDIVFTNRFKEYEARKGL